MTRTLLNKKMRFTINDNLVSLHVNRLVLISKLNTSPRSVRFVLRRSGQNEKAVSAAADVGVVGSGAAGLAAAYFAANEGSSVILFEKNDESGKKILISGGTRCNVLPGSVQLASDFSTESKQGALKSVFSRWSLDECREWIENDVGITLSLEESTNKLFPASNSAKEVRDKLLKASINAGVSSIKYSHDLQSIERQEDYLVCSFKGIPDEYRFKSLILATGGKSFPTLGTTGEGWKILESLGHTLTPVYPALTPLKGDMIGPDHSSLAGISLHEVDLSVMMPSDGPKRKRLKSIRTNRRDFLITHKGFSGPAVLDISEHFVREMERGSSAMPKLKISWIHGVNDAAWDALLQNPKVQSGVGSNSMVTTVLRAYGITHRLAINICNHCEVPIDRKISELRKEERKRLSRCLSECTLNVTGHEGYPKAEVTGGGIPLSEVDCKSMESRIAPNIFICGELLDVHGRIGGFNFLWAWVSGRLAGLGAASACKQG